MFIRLWTVYIGLALAGAVALSANGSEGPGSKRLVPGELLASISPEPGTTIQDTNPVFKFHIDVVKGEDGVNIVKKKTAVQPVVEVRDKNNLPVSGAVVIFTAPGNGASAVFSNGSRSLTMITDSAGRASVAGMKPVGTGAFKLGVSASFHGQIATATVAQTNFATAAAASAAGASTAATSGGAAGGAAAGGVATGAASGAGLSAGVIGAIVGGVAAAAAGAAVAVTHSGGSKPPSSISIGLGTGAPVVGAPH